MFYNRRSGLTALMALDHNILDSQQTTLAWGHSFKNDLQRKEKKHITAGINAHTFKMSHTHTHPTKQRPPERLNHDLCHQIGRASGIRPILETQLTSAIILKLIITWLYIIFTFKKQDVQSLEKYQCLHELIL